MSEMDSHLKLALASIRCFTDDGTLDEQEVNYLLGIALADNVIDDDEKDTLSNIFSKVTKSEVDERTWNRIQEIKKKYDIA